MKNFIIFSSLIICLPAFAVCAIDEGDTSCSIAEFQQKEMNPTYSTKPMLNEFSGSPEARLKPAENPASKVKLQDFGNEPKDFSYNADCQFGVCKNNSGAPQPFERREH